MEIFDSFDSLSNSKESIIVGYLTNVVNSFTEDYPDIHFFDHYKAYLLKENINIFTIKELNDNSVVEYVDSTSDLNYNIYYFIISDDYSIFIFVPKSEKLLNEKFNKLVYVNDN